MLRTISEVNSYATHVVGSGTAEVTIDCAKLVKKFAKKKAKKVKF